jgi:hypothetical protein
MKSFIVFILIHSAAMAQVRTLDDFLVNTLLGAKAEFVEKAYHLNKEILKDWDGYHDISNLKYEKLNFKVSAFFRGGECKAFGLYTSQVRIKDVDGRLKYHDEADIDDVFQNLLVELTKRFGKAPLVALGPDSSNFGMEVPCLAYTWANDRYSLMLVLWDNATTHSLTLRQYRIDETNGEFTGEEQISYLQKLYATRSGVLPADWPVTTWIDVPGAGQSLNEDPPKEIPDKKAAVALVPEDGTSAKKGESDNTRSFVWSSVLLLIALLIGAGFWIKTYR